jgi:hypothetical protein
MRTTKQKQLLASHFLGLKETYMIRDESTLTNEVVKDSLQPNPLQRIIRGMCYKYKLYGDEAHYGSRTMILKLTRRLS